MPLAHGPAARSDVAPRPAWGGRHGVRRQLQTAKRPDLDAWLLLDDSHLVVVECKHRTASSIDGITVPDEPGQLAAYARQQWTTLKADHIDTDGWTDHDKVYLPLRPSASLSPAAAARAMSALRRVLDTNLVRWHQIQVRGHVDHRQQRPAHPGQGPRNSLRRSTCDPYATAAKPA